MISLNVSFGIFAFLPQGWIFMLFVIVMEGFLISRFFGRKWNHTETYFFTLASNGVSGIVGFIASILLNGGWWLVIWFPWVSNNEVDITSAESFNWLMIYYCCAFILTIIIEVGVNILCFKSQPKTQVIKATLLANVISYIIGSVLLYCYSFDVF